MSMIASWLVAASAAILLLLGLAHVLFTFRGPRLPPRDPNLQRRMEEVSPVITRRTATALYVLGLVASRA